MIRALRRRQQRKRSHAYLEHVVREAEKTPVRVPQRNLVIDLRDPVSPERTTP